MKPLIGAMILVIPLMVLAEVENVGFLGVVCKDLDDAMKAAAGVDHGVLVESVTVNSPAEKSGIAVGDIILKINDNEIKNYDEMKDVIEEMPNQKVNIIVYRDAKQMTKSVTLGQRDKNKMKFEINMPDFSQLKELLNRSDETLKKELADLKAEVEKLKMEIENLKKQLEEKK